MKEMKIVMMPLSELRHPDRNVRMHPDKQIREFVRSIKKSGQTRPFVIDENNEVLIGNGMLEAMLAAGETEGACIIKTGMTRHDKIQLMMSDNKIFDLGVDDMSVFDELLKELDGDLDIPGYDMDLLEALTSDPDEVDGLVTEYGIVPAERAESIRAAASSDDDAVPHSDAVATPAGEPVDVPEVETTPTRSFVVCPKCGEKIWL